jgi:phosphoribosylaminoimidazole carboxylase PurE protein
MIDEKFQEIMQSNTGCAVIMAGSDSDRKHIEKIVASLKQYEIPHEVRICSAHKQPDTLKEIIGEYNGVGGSYAIIAVAGGTDALSGTASFHAFGPLISCPPDAPNQSCLTNPPGSSNAYVARANNVGKIVAQIYAGVNPRFRELLDEKNVDKINKLEQKDIEFQKEFLYLGE